MCDVVPDDSPGELRSVSRIDQKNVKIPPVTVYSSSTIGM